MDATCQDPIFQAADRNGQMALLLRPALTLPRCVVMCGHGTRGGKSGVIDRALRAGVSSRIERMGSHQDALPTRGGLVCSPLARDLNSIGAW